MALRDGAEVGARVVREADEEGLERVAEGPTADHAVVGQDHEARRDEDHAEPAPGVAPEVGERRVRS